MNVLKPILVLAVCIAVAPILACNPFPVDEFSRSTAQGILSSAPRLLHRCPANPRYFCAASGKAIYLTGSHTWSDLIDRGPTDPPPSFDFDRYLDFLQRSNHN